MSNETLQSSKGRAIKAHIKLMGLVIRGSIKRIRRAASRFGDRCRRLINRRGSGGLIFKIAYPQSSGGVNSKFFRVYACSPETNDSLPQQAHIALAVHPSVPQCA